MRRLCIAISLALSLSLFAAPAVADDLDAPITTPTAQAEPVVEAAETSPPETVPESAPDPSPEAADDPVVEPRISWSATSYTGYLGTTVAVGGALDGPESATARIAVRRDQTWVALPVVVTRTGTSFTARLPLDTARAEVRAELVEAGEIVASSEPAIATGVRAASTLTLYMPSKVVDYRQVDLIARWLTKDGRKPTGSVDLVFKKRGAKSYARYRTLKLTRGRVQTKITPRQDGRFALRYPGGTTLVPATSASKAFDNRPPGTVVKLPKGASRPSIKLPAQARADRVKADAKVSKISDAMWKSMVGRSWHRGCPVGRGSLRVVRVSYWAFDGYVRRGEIVVNTKHSAATARVFTDLFNRRTPIRSMYRVDRFGWSKTLRGADDYRSMKADNTSGFNCRGVVGAPQRRSPHSTGKSIDINPWENPYRSPKGWTPNGSWQKRTSPTSVTWRGRNDPVVKIFRKHGFRWLGGFDLHHFER